jgi:ADP-dependent NAD(P)H-hydrate dehydratase / NAD(P)H-hydrate epimerase
MKVLNAEQIKAWDQYTIKADGIASVELMERAASKCVEWLEQTNLHNKSFSIFCGKGNNGGDGLAIARNLSEKDCHVTVYILEFGHKGTEDFQINLARLHQYPEVEIRFLQTEKNFHSFSNQEVVIDALYGSGLNRPLEGVTAKLVDHINSSGCEVVAIDIPSGLFVDKSSKNNPAIKAKHTLSFQCYKPAFMVPENAEYIGDVHILDIGLRPEYYDTVVAEFEITDEDIIHSVYKPRNRFAHKGNFGHAIMIAGSYGKIGAAVLAAQSCLRSGVGLLTAHIPKCGYEIMQSAVPEAMVSTDFNSSFITKLDTDILKFDAVGIGPGIGTASETKSFLTDIFQAYKKPIVIDADALNMIATQKELINSIPAGSILTPHPKEFERLFGTSDNDFDRIRLAQQKAKELGVVLVLKGHHTFITSPKGKNFFNSTGNAGMATGGSGDVLTGILTGLIAQKYLPVDAAILGVYLHGLAGDIAANKNSMEAMIASDIIDNLNSAFQKISDS